MTPDRVAVREFDSPIGRLAVEATPRGLARVVLPAPGATPAPSAAREAGASPASAGGPGRGSSADAHAARAEAEIREYLGGRRREFTVPLDLAAVAPFHRRALEATARIPYGETASYGEVARRLGRPGAARAVGRAMATNPVPLVVPCHRVVASGGGLGGYGGGLDLKRRLLALERAAVAPG